MNLTYVEKPSLSSDELNVLFAQAWPSHVPRDFTPVLAHSLTYFAAYHNDELTGFVNLAWDGGAHAFLLDPTVHPRVQRQGIGSKLVEYAIIAARRHNVEWIHVDYEPRLAPFYEALGFRSTTAGLLQLIRQT